MFNLNLHRFVVVHHDFMFTCLGAKLRFDGNIVAIPCGPHVADGEITNVYYYSNQTRPVRNLTVIYTH